MRGFNFANISRIDIELTFSNDFELNRKIKLDSLHRNQSVILDRRRSNSNKNNFNFDLPISFFHLNIFAGFNFAKMTKIREARKS